MKLALLAFSFFVLPACRSSATHDREVGVRGVVVDASGHPLAGVRYWVSATEQRTDDGWQLVQRSGLTEMRFTPADGRFAVPDPEGLRYDLDFDASGYAPSFVQQAEPNAELRVVLERGRDVRGRIVQRDSAATSAAGYGRVSLRRPNARGLWFVSEVLAEADGSFVFSNFLPRAPTASDPGWQLVCVGAVQELRERADGSVPEVVIEIAFRSAP